MKLRKKLFPIVIGVICLLNLTTFANCENDFYDEIVNNPYRELRIPPWSSIDQVKQKYKELVKAYHPDKTKNRNAHEKFLAIQKAYEKIKNRRKSAEKDESYDDYDDYDSEEINSFYDALSDAMKLISGCWIFLSLIYLISWLCHKFYAIVYAPLFSIFTSFVLCDRIFPHYFKNHNTQILYSLLFGVLIFYSKKILNYIFARMCKKTTVKINDKKNK